MQESNFLIYCNCIFGRVCVQQKFELVNVCGYFGDNYIKNASC